MTFREAHAESCRRRGWSEAKIALRQKLADGMMPDAPTDTVIPDGQEERLISLLASMEIPAVEPEMGN